MVTLLSQAAILAYKAASLGNVGYHGLIAACEFKHLISDVTFLNYREVGERIDEWATLKREEERNRNPKEQLAREQVPPC